MNPNSTMKQDSERPVLSQACSTRTRADRTGTTEMNTIQITGGATRAPKKPLLTTHLVGLNSINPTIVNCPKDIHTKQTRKKGMSADASI